LAQHCAAFSGAQQDFFTGFVSSFIVLLLAQDESRDSSFRFSARAASQSSHGASGFAAWVRHVAMQLSSDWTMIRTSFCERSTWVSWAWAMYASGARFALHRRAFDSSPGGAMGFAAR